MELNKDLLDSVRRVAKDWEPGIVILKPLDGDFVFIAVSRVDFFDPSNNIHHTTVEGKDVTLAIVQKIGSSDPLSGKSIMTFINNIGFEDVWEVPTGIEFYWIKIKQVV